MERARRDIAEGFEWAVDLDLDLDLDLDRFFDRVNQDRLMSRVAARVDDKRLLPLVRRYLDAGVMVDGVRQPTEQGTPRAPRSARCSPTSTSQTSTKSWTGAGTATSATPTTS